MYYLYKQSLAFKLLLCAVLLASCDTSPLETMHQGQIEMTVSFKNTKHPSITTLNKAGAINRMAVRVIDSEGNQITSVNLNKEGTDWIGTIEVEPGTGLTIQAEAYESGAKPQYLGLRSNVSVLAGESTNVDIVLNRLAPTPCFEITPDSGTTTTTITFDASCSTDPQDSSDELQVRWDFDGDGVYDTPYSTDKTTTHQYNSAGIKAVTLSVLNIAGLSAEIPQSINIDAAEIHTITNIQISPSSPATLDADERVNVTFNYSTTEETGVRIWPQPYRDGVYASGGAYSASSIYPEGEGSGSGFVTLLSSRISVPTSINQIRFLMRDADQTQILFDTLVTVNYTFNPVQRNPVRPSGEDCVTLNPNALTVSNSNGIWQLISNGNHAVLSFPNESEANRAKDIIEHYGLDEHCFVGRPNSSFDYWLVDQIAPEGFLSGEDCISMNPNNLEVRFVNGTWKIVEDTSIGTILLLDFGSSVTEANDALRFIQFYGFQQQCFVGRPGASMIYYRKN